MPRDVTLGLSQLQQQIAAVASDNETAPAEKRISMRSPDEILKMPDDPHANMAGDNLVQKSGSLVVAGVGSLGKSRLIEQWLVDMIIGRPCCGIPTNAPGTRWVVFQTQNSNRRLKKDLVALKKYAGGDWSLVQKNLLFHTLENDEDRMLHLSAPDNAAKIHREVVEFEADGVVFDPLDEFGIGNLNSDEDMRSTIREISHIVYTGNPERTVIIVTHALTGTAGMKRAFGFEGSSFGRNSKVLFNWTRGFVNAVPGNEEKTIIVLSNPKVSDGKPFENFAIELNGDLIFELRPDFDIDTFLEQIEKPKKERRKFDPEIIAEIEWPKPELSKKRLAVAIMEETGCKSSRAYELIDEAVIRRVIRYNKLTEIYKKITRAR
jgi:hypothetical protein